MQNGVGVSLLVSEHTPVDIVKYATEAEDKGLHSVWISEEYGGGNPFAIIGAIANITKRITLASGVVSAFLHHPVVLGTTAVTLSSLSSGRFILGLGTGVRECIEENLGLPFEPAITRMEECVKIVREISTQGRCDFQGNTLKARNVRLLTRPISVSPPLYIAGIARQMVALAGKIADGLIVTVCSSPGYVKRVREVIHRVRSGPGHFEIVGLVLVCLDENSEAARRKVKPYVASMMSRPGRAKEMLEPESFDPELVSRIRNMVKKGRQRKAGSQISDELAAQVAASGTEHECFNFITEMVKAGITLPVLLPYETNMRKLLSFARSVDENLYE